MYRKADTKGNCIRKRRNLIGLVWIVFYIQLLAYLYVLNNTFNNMLSLNLRLSDYLRLFYITY